MKHFGEHDGGLGLPRAEAAPDPRRARRAPRDPLGARTRRHEYAFTSDGAHRRSSGASSARTTAASRRSSSATIGDPAKTPLPVDISLSSDDRFLFVDTFMDGKVRVFDVSDPRAPKLVHEQKIGAPGQHGLPVLGREARSTSPARCSRTGTGAAPTTSSSCGPSPGTARRSSPSFAIDFRAAEARPPAHHALRAAEAFCAGRPLQQVATSVSRGAVRVGAVCAGRRSRSASRRAARAPTRAATEAPARGAERSPAPARASSRRRPGSYELPPIGRVEDHLLLGSGRRARAAARPRAGRGRARLVRLPRLPRRLPDRDRGAPAGRPRARGATRRLAGRVALVTVSFDPARDTPAQMAACRASARAARPLALPHRSGSPPPSRPVLADFGQDVALAPPARRAAASRLPRAEGLPRRRRGPRSGTSTARASST